MRGLFARFFPGWAMLLIGALGFVAWLHHGWAGRVEYLSNLERDRSEIAGPSDARTAQKRWFIVPAHNAHSYQWMAETQQMLRAKNLRVRRVDYENAPYGREVHSASPYRWWLAAIAWTVHATSDQSWEACVEKAALLADPLLHVLLLVGTTLFVARRFGGPAAAVSALGLATAFPFATHFLPGSPDIYGLAHLLGLWSVLPLLAGMSGRKCGASARPANQKESDAQQSPRWFFMAGVIGGFGLWVSAANQAPVLAGIMVGAAVAAFVRRTPGPANATGESALLPWRAWSMGGALTCLLAYVAEYSTADMSLRLQVNHPLYGLAWLGAGELLAQLEQWRVVGKSFWRRREMILLGLAVIALGSLPCAMVWGKNFPAPDSLASHLGNLPTSPVAKNLAAWLHRDGFSADFVAACLPLVLFAPLFWLAIRRATPSRERRALLIALGPTLVALILAHAQLRWWAAWEGLLLAPLALAAAMTAALPDRKARRWWGATACVAFGFGLTRLVPAAAMGEKNEFAPREIEGLLERGLAHWLADHAGPEGAVVLLPPDRTAEFCFHGGLRGLGTPNWENRDGLAATIRIVSATSADEAKALLDQRGVTHLVLPSWDNDLDAFARWTVGRPEDSFIHAVQRWALPPWLRPLPYQLPKVAGFENQTVTVFAVTDETDRALALSRLAEYFLEMHQPEMAAAAGQALLPYPANLGGLVARAEIARTRDNPTEFSQILNLLLSNLANGLDRDLPWDRRVSLAVLLAQANRTDLARVQLQRCLQELSETKIRSLTTESLYRLLVLSKAFELTIEPALRARALQLIPAEARTRL
jgi:hypothetical protein